MSNDELPKAVIVQDGKVPGDVPPAAAVPPPAAGPRVKHKRKLSNLLIDKKLQLRYVLLVTLLSALISGSLGFLIYKQEHRATEDVAASLGELDPEFQKQVSKDMEARDQELLLKMAGAGLGLTVILSLYLIIMTHKVAGPLFKVSMYFDRMAEGRLGKVTPLRKGDMLMDFYSGFREMHDAVRGRLQGDLATMQKFVDACAAAGVDRSGALGDELDELEKHLAARRDALA
ncbi:MAG: hypothetical protein H6709_02830 [Kofleriaceae bacterium]|nr:hypothetical protein [Myxococcales bacterium]MCB9562683.1 hypothetical protein [Kofleriaceae bacterium]MCB9571002.1 hypothetical protein [Kofleriaceae bacterium]